MSDETTSPRLQQFQTDVDDLRVTGGRTNTERVMVMAGVLAFVAAVVIEIVALSRSSSATDPREQTDMVILALLGIVVALGAVALFIRASLTRWLRYWLVRLIYENREQTDQLINAREDDRS